MLLKKNIFKVLLHPYPIIHILQKILSCYLAWFDDLFLWFYPNNSFRIPCTVKASAVYLQDIVVVDPDESLLASLPSCGAQATEGLPSTSSPRSYNSGYFHQRVLLIRIFFFGSKFFHLGSASKNLGIFNPKTVSKLLEKLSRIQGSKKHRVPDPETDPKHCFLQPLLWIWVRIGSEFNQISGSGFRKAILEKQQINQLSLKICQQLFSFSRAGGFFHELG